MRRLAQAALGAALLLGLAGCSSLCGTWTMQEIVPPGAKGDFDMGTIKFTRDGRYTSRATYEGQVRELTGTYTFDREAERLTFRMPEGRERTYGARVCGCHDLLYVWDVDGPKDWTATLRR